MQDARGEGKTHAVFWWENLKERDHLEDLNVDGKVISKYIFKNYNSWGEAWTGLGHMSGSCEQGDEPSGSIKCGEFLD